MTRYLSNLYDSDRWNEFEFRDGDIVISTPPKCGTTWMQMICALLVFQDAELPEPLGELSPWLDNQITPMPKLAERLAAQTHRRFVKTHTPLDGLPPDERATYICLGRDPRDVAVSFGNHLANMNHGVVTKTLLRARPDNRLAPPGTLLPQDPTERFWQWIELDPPDAEAEVRQNVSCLRSTVHHLATAWDRRDAPNVLLCHFADLEAGLGAEMRRIAAALEIAVPEDVWPALVEAATFSRMRERAQELAPEAGVRGWWRDTDKFFNSGSSGQWRALVAQDDLGRYDDRLAKLAGEELTRWLHEGNRGDGGTTPSR